MLRVGQSAQISNQPVELWSEENQVSTSAMRSVGVCDAGPYKNGAAGRSQDFAIAEPKRQGTLQNMPNFVVRLVDVEIRRA